MGASERTTSARAHRAGGMTGLDLTPACPREANDRRSSVHTPRSRPEAFFQNADGALASGDGALESGEAASESAAAALEFAASALVLGDAGERLGEIMLELKERALEPGEGALAFAESNAVLAAAQ